MTAGNKQTPAAAANDERSALADLKALLMGPEQAAIDRLQHDNEDRQVQTERVSASLPQSLRRAYQQDAAELSSALEAPVSACIEDSVQRNPGFFADILYPVMGPAIRRSITQAMKSLVQQINLTLEHSLSFKGLRWRVEAMRSGVPFAEIVLRHTLLYRVEEAFLIQSGSGLLIRHVGHSNPAPNEQERDADAVSAMLTAIRDFTRDTIDRDGEDTRLESIDVGDHTLWLVHGPDAYLACAIRGIPPLQLRDDMNDVLEQIHHRHAQLLENFDGDDTATAPLVPLLDRCLQSEREQPPRKGPPWPLLIIASLLLAALGWWLYTLWQDGNELRARQAAQDAAIASLRQAPGIVVTDITRIDDHLNISGLHDPLMPAPADRLVEAGLADSDFTLSFQPFQSSDADAALRRARQRLSPPDGVELDFAQGTLQLRGTADNDWRQRAELLALTVPGINTVDSSALEDSDTRLLRELRAALQPPDDVQIRVERGHATLTGQAPLAWIRSLGDAPPQLSGLLALDHGTLKPYERARLAQLVTLIEAASVAFADGTEIAQGQQVHMDSIAALVAEAYQHAMDLGHPMRLQVIGRTDGVGTVEQNLFIASRRADAVAERLRASQAPMPPIDLRTLTEAAQSNELNIDLRRVEFHVTGIDKN
ncbi:MAG: hypothetical protein KDI82_02855 [Gammaproteobacteria bacterium]|nr:hypothetical protein [Gammaproteobacteria bacterium]